MNESITQITQRVLDSKEKELRATEDFTELVGFGHQKPIEISLTHYAG